MAAKELSNVSKRMDLSRNRKVATSSGKMKGMGRQEEQSRGVRDSNQAAVGGGMSGSGVGSSRVR